jgi:hypothetical protein
VAIEHDEQGASQTNLVKTRFFTVGQNNSGGNFDHVPDYGIGYKLCVEAVDAAHAQSRLDHILNSYPGRGYDCPCCGDRWSMWIDDEDGADRPESYGRPLAGGWGIPSYVHYLDGRIVPVSA